MSSTKHLHSVAKCLFLFLLLKATFGRILIVDQKIKSPLSVGSEEAPFNTIQECVDELKATGQPGDECQIRKGRYHEDITIDGLIGTEDKPYVITGYKTERPILDGTVIIEPASGSTWKPVKKGSKIYSTKITQNIWQLFVDEKMMTNARWPNSKWSDYSIFNGSLWSRLDNKSKKGLMINKGNSLADTNINMAGAMAIMNIGSFNTYVAEIDKHTAGENEFEYTDTFGDYKFKPKISRYYIEDKLELLDSPEEWFYDKATNQLYVWLPNNQSPAKHQLRGKVQTYAMKITNTKHLVLKNLEFFATTISATSDNFNLIDNIRFDSLIFNFPTYSKRMLGDISLIERGKVLGKSRSNYGSFVFFNNTFYGSDGIFMDVIAKKVTYENNLIEYNDWSAANEIYRDGGWGVIKAKGALHENYIRNTLRYNGISHGIQPGGQSTIHLNHIIGQCWGVLQNDGAGVQVQRRPQFQSILSYNWVHSSPKYGLRFDGEPPKIGENGTISHNVVYRTNGLMVKGDNHLVKNNLAFQKYDAGDSDEQGTGCTLCVLQFVRYNKGEINKNSEVINNIADVANGGKDVWNRPNVYPLAGRVERNNLKSAKVTEQLTDPKNFDFRPMKESDAALKGIGPYTYGSAMSKYWIPGRQLYKTSTPVPIDGSITVIAKRRDALMFLQAYDCSKHHIFFGEDKEEVREDNLEKKKTYKGELMNGDNVFYLPDSSMPLDDATRYFWRVDAEMDNGDVYIGDVWSFTTK